MAFKLFPIIEAVDGAVDGELDFLKLLYSFKHVSNDKKAHSSVSKKLHIVNKLIIISNIVFITLIVMDFIFTNILNPPIPFYTMSIYPDFRWSFFPHNNILILYILFVMGVSCGCCYCLACVYTAFTCWELDGSEYSSGWVTGEEFRLCADCICCGPCIFALFLIICIVLFCLSPPTLLYTFYIFYLLTNSGKILFQKGLLDDKNNNYYYYAEDLIGTLNTISSRFGEHEIGIIHHRLVQYLIAYILWPSDDIKYESIQKNLINKIENIFKTKYDKAIQECRAVSFNESIGSDLMPTKVAIDLFFNVNISRIIVYATVSVVLYITIIASFWICYYLILKDTNHDFKLFLFYLISYCVYILLLFLLIYLVWIQFKFLFIEKYEWLLPFIGSYIRRIVYSKDRFQRETFISFYNDFCNQYITYQTLTIIFEQSMDNGMQQWMMDVIASYVIGDDLQFQIDAIYGHYNNQGPTAYWTSCVTDQSTQFIRFLNEHSQ